MKKILIIILVLVLVASGFFFFHHSSNKQITNYPSSGTTIVAFGDSLTYGYGATAGNDYVSDLSKSIGQPIINLGENGDTTEDALGRVDSVLSKDPKVVILLLGGNDFLRQVDPAVSFKNLGEIISDIQAKGAVVVLLGVQGGLFGDKYKDQFEDLASEYHTAYVPNVLDGIIGHSDLMFDTVHPNDAGYKKIAGKVSPVLQSVIK